MFLSCFSFQPSTLSFQSTFPSPYEVKSFQSSIHEVEEQPTIFSKTKAVKTDGRAWIGGRASGASTVPRWRAIPELQTSKGDFVYMQSGGSKSIGKRSGGRGSGKGKGTIKCSRAGEVDEINDDI